MINYIRHDEQFFGTLKLSTGEEVLGELLVSQCPETQDDMIFIQHPAKTKVIEIWRTPTYYNYHWLAHPSLDKRFGKGFTNKLTNVFINFNEKSPEQKQILEIFGAKK